MSVMGLEGIGREAWKRRMSRPGLGVQGTEWGQIAGRRWTETKGNVEEGVRLGAVWQGERGKRLWVGGRRVSGVMEREMEGVQAGGTGG